MYVTARGAANALAVSLARELGRDNIQVNAIAPNYVESPTYFPPELVNDPDALARMTRNIPLGRLGKADELAALVAFYASDKSDFITGHVMPFAGGVGLNAATSVPPAVPTAITPATRPRSGANYNAGVINPDSDRMEATSHEQVRNAQRLACAKGNVAE